MLTLAIGLLAALPAAAVEPITEQSNECLNPGGQGLPCATEADCALNLYATICVEHTPGEVTSRACEIPCETGSGLELEPDRAACAVGETCREAKATPGRKAYYCQPTKFRVDLNLLDQCVVHFLSGLQPSFSTNQCSLEANLTRLLDQNGDLGFDIFDLDLCVLAFLEQPGCDLQTGLCSGEGLTPCAEDAACGAGLYCDTERHVCQRDCGIIASREDEFGELDRQCTGALKTCDYARGRCELIDVEDLTCQVAADCPPGAYCLVGRCAPQCYRGVDCPSTQWVCAPDNTCRAAPSPEADEGFVFDPKRYAVRFGRDELQLNAIQTSDASALAIMDLVTKRQVVDNPSVSFGYRLQLGYGLKQDQQCLEAVSVLCDAAGVDLSGYAWANPATCSGDKPCMVQACQAQQKDCIIDDSEQWIRLVSPFGLVSAAGRKSLALELETAVADKLSPGRYVATLQAIFDNGDSDSVPVVLTKATPSGEYEGKLTLYRQQVENALNGSRPLYLSMRIELLDETTQWDTLMQQHHLNPAGSGGGGSAAPLIDITEGRLVRARLHGNDTLLYTRGDATSVAQNEVPLVGIYSPELGRIRLIGIIDIPASLCIGEKGSCTKTDPDQVTDTDPVMVMNLFGRPIRRQIEFFGPFDDAAARFHGIYRETITGMAPGGITLEGGFILDQLLQDSSPVAAKDGLILTSGGGIDYPAQSELLAATDDRLTLCPAEKHTPIASKTAWRSYLTSARRSGPATPTSALGRTTMFPSLVDFRSHIDVALAALQTATTAGQQQHLNIYEFLSERLVPCDSADPQPPAACIAEKAVRCGLLEHQHAILDGWVNQDAVKNAADKGDLELFCLDTVPTEGCSAVSTGAPELFALQEHGRFWSNLAQILKFQADRARSNAFLVLFKNEVNPFAQGAALSYKADQLRDAVAGYDKVIKQIVGKAPSAVLFGWPARAFKQAGFDWLKTMRTIASDRMDAIAELVDLRRRVFLSTSETDFIFAHHMLQQEFLLQVYLMELQARWQGELFSYDGHAGQALERGQQIVAQLNPAKNPIGVTPGQVFFENGNPDRSNWQGFRDTLVGDDGEGGLLGDARGHVLDAVGELKAAVADVDALEASLKESKGALEDTLDGLCGDPKTACNAALAAFSDAGALAADVRCLLSGSSCTNPWATGGTELTCPAHANKLTGSDTCSELVLGFKQGITDLSGTPGLYSKPDCHLQAAGITVNVNGTMRPCAGGEVGALIQERALVDLQRQIVLKNFYSLVAGLKTKITAYTKTNQVDDDLEKLVTGLDAATRALDLAILVGDWVLVIYKERAGTVDCIFIAGVAAGTDCPQKAASTLMAALGEHIWDSIKFAFAIAKQGMEIKKGVAEKEAENQKKGYEQGLELDGMADASPLLDEYLVLTQTAFNMSLQTMDLRAKAQAAVDQYGEDVGFVADHLVGRETGSLLRGDHLVKKATGAFRQILLVTYKMTQAFAHHYNLPPGDAAALSTQALALVTLDEVADFAAGLDKREQDYCGQEAIDCDAMTNIGVVRYSLRDTLFPNLRDVIDGKTGKVVTAGQQFHNLITAPPFLKRRLRGTIVVDQVELPFGVTLNVQENTKNGQPAWLIDPLTCNHMLDAHDPADPLGTHTGNLAVEVMGANLGSGVETLHYELIRGPTDLARSCHVESVVKDVGTLPVAEYPVRTHVIGYAPQNLEGQKDDPQSYVTRSNPLPACLSEAAESADLDGAPCWRFFGRDRTLSSLDWKLVVPLVADGAATGNTWVTGEGLPEEARPVIEDIVLYFRYRARPIEE
jgi:hypothetical protein